jgi:GT2 family glycosyltransferase
MVKNNCVIILVNYNGFEDTKDCIRSIKQTNGELPYIVLVDNGSNNANELELLKQEYLLLKIIYNKENIGFGRANNAGIKWAQEQLEFEFLLLLNNDTLIEPDTLEYLIEPFSKDSHIGIATGKTMYEGNRDIVWYGGGEINYRRGWPKITDFNKKATSNGANKLRFVSFVSGCVMMFCKESLKELRGFDDDFFMYCEDLELSMRAQKLGFKLFYEPKSVIYHKVQGSMKNAAHSKVTGMNAANHNLSFLFYNMKSNQYIAMKKGLTFWQFQIFKLLFWVEFCFVNLKLLTAGRFDMVGISSKTIKKIYEFK